MRRRHTDSTSKRTRHVQPAAPSSSCPLRSSVQSPPRPSRSDTTHHSPLNTHHSPPPVGGERSAEKVERRRPRAVPAWRDSLHHSPLTSHHSPDRPCSLAYTRSKTPKKAPFCLTFSRAQNAIQESERSTHPIMPQEYPMRSTRSYSVSRLMAQRVPSAPDRFGLCSLLPEGKLRHRHRGSTSNRIKHCSIPFTAVAQRHNAPLTTHHSPLTTSP
jgi:hypothetical protein